MKSWRRGPGSIRAFLLTVVANVLPWLQNILCPGTATQAVL